MIEDLCYYAIVRGNENGLEGLNSKTVLLKGLLKTAVTQNDQQGCA